MNGATEWRYLIALLQGTTKEHYYKGRYSIVTTLVMPFSPGKLLNMAVII